MSINDFLNSDTFIPTLFTLAIIFIIIGIPVGLARANKVNENLYGDGETGTVDQAKNAKIVGKSTSPHPLNQTITVNKVIFELTDGERMELAIRDQNTYGIMVEGDCGTLTYQGKKFVKFERNI